jgi:hypothetical protein
MLMVHLPAPYIFPDSTNKKRPLASNGATGMGLAARSHLSSRQHGLFIPFLRSREAPVGLALISQ